MKYKKYRRFYLPKLIVDYILYINEKYSIEGTNKSSLEVPFSIINDIISKTDMYNRDENYSVHHIPMYSKYLEVKYGNEYKEFINWMYKYNIIWCDDFGKGKATHYYLQPIEHYSELLKSYLRLNNEDTTPYTYSTIKGIEITPVAFIGKGKEKIQKSGIFSKYCEIKIEITKQNKNFLTKDSKTDARYINNAPKHIKAMGQYYKKNLKIDFEKATNHSIDQYQTELDNANTIDEKQRAFRRYSTRLDSIMAIRNGRNNKSLRFNRNPTNRRIDTNLTNMASDLRPFIVGYDNMSYLDLKNSQPVLFNILLKSKRKDATPNQIEELDKYFKLTTNGKWYEHLAIIFDCNRETAKEDWMVIAYSKNSTPKYKPLKQEFKKYYPYINQIIEQYKKKNHNQFAIELQKIESKLFIDKICKALVKENIIPYTFHDAILIPTKFQSRALEIMQIILKKEIGTIPQISIERGDSHIKTINGSSNQLPNTNPINTKEDRNDKRISIYDQISSLYKEAELEIDLNMISDIQSILNKSYTSKDEVCRTIIEIFKENRYQKSHYSHIEIPKKLVEKCVSYLKRTNIKSV